MPPPRPRVFDPLFFVIESRRKMENEMNLPSPVRKFKQIQHMSPKWATVALKRMNEWRGDSFSPRSALAFCKKAN
jgi:hypothetical protein